MTLRQSTTFGGITWQYGLASNFMPVASPGKTIVGKSGANNTLSGAGYDTLVGGGAGGDNFFLLGRGDRAVAGAGDGIDTIATYFGDVTLPVGFANGILNHAGTITGNAANNVLTARGAGVHTLHAGSGNDLLIGSATGVDRFVIAKGAGNDVVVGFRHGVDKVELDNFAGSSSAQSFATLKLAMTQVGANVVLALGGQTLTFAGATKAQFTAADFALPLNLTGFHKTFDDEFNTFNASADGHTTTWRTVSGTLSGNKEAEYYSNKVGPGGPFSLSNGVLDITASPTSTVPGLPYTSGEINTARSFSQTYGYFEMRAQLPAGAGMWPAFWLLPTDGSWPPELDAMEMLGSDPTTIYTSTHSQVASAKTLATHVADTSKGFHTYGVDWEPDRVTYYFDGNAISSLATPADMNKPMYMIVNLSVGGVGSWPGAATGETGHLLVDYVRAYASPTAVQPPLMLVNWGETINKGDGNFSITGTGGGGWINLGNGNQTIHLTGTPGTVQGSANTIVTGNGNQAITTVGNSNVITTGAGTSTVDAGASYARVTLGASLSGTTTVTATGYGDVVTAVGNGNFTITGMSGSASISLKDGNDSVTLGGSGNNVTVGSGTSTIIAGSNQATVHAGGGNVTISVGGWGNLLDAGPGTNFLNGGNGYDRFVLNGAGQGLDTITGFTATNYDVLDFTRALSGLPLAADLSNIGQFVSTQFQGGATAIMIDPTGGGGSPQLVAMLGGVHTTLAELLSRNDIRVGVKLI